MSAPAKLRVLDLFSGIGGFSLGLERTGGFETVAFCEIEEFPRKVLAKHWPEVPIYEDVRKLTADGLVRDGIAVDVITGGFPCQDVSVAGPRAGLGAETRSGLWSEIVRLTRDLRPRYVIVENVANLLSGPTEKRGGWFGRVLGDLAAIGYDAEWHCIPASAVGAAHERDRAWIVAYAPGFRSEADTGPLWGPFAARFLADPDLSGREEQWGGFPSRAQHEAVECGREWPAEPDVDRVVYGLPGRVDRLKALGNAVVPQIPEMIGRAILAAESEAA